jgi:aspergillopepsin I
VSRTFAKDPANDGLLGLAFSRLNTIKPKAQLTWFDNVKPKLAAPVFTCSLKRHEVGSYDFGYIDKAKYKGEIVWTNVRSAKGFWDFTATGFAVGRGEVKSIAINAVADTGSSLWYLPRAIADAYYREVEGAQFNQMQSGWMFPCNAKLPDMALVVSGKKITVPGTNMNYQKLSQSTCFGGIQRDTGMPFSIAGDVFLKEMFVVFENAPGTSPRLGFAPAAR